MATNWRSYGLSQSRGSLPSGPVTVMVHMASVWVPFTSESKEAIACYPEIQKELRLGAASRRPQAGHVSAPAPAGEARGGTAEHLSALSGRSGDRRERHQRSGPRQGLYDQLLEVAKKKTADADVKFDERGQAVAEDEKISATTC